MERFQLTAVGRRNVGAYEDEEFEVFALHVADFYDLSKASSFIQQVDSWEGLCQLLNLDPNNFPKIDFLDLQVDTIDSVTMNIAGPILTARVY